MALEPMGYTAANRRTIKLMVEQAAPLFEDGSAPMFMVMADAIVAVAVGKLFYAIAPAGAAYAGEKRLYLRTAGAPFYEDQGNAAAPATRARVDAAAAENAQAVAALAGRQEEVEETVQGALSSSSYRPTPEAGADLPVDTYFLAPNAADGGTLWVYQRIAGAPGYVAVQKQEISADQVADGGGKRVGTDAEFEVVAGVPAIAAANLTNGIQVGDWRNVEFDNEGRIIEARDQDNNRHKAFAGSLVRVDPHGEMNQGDWEHQEIDAAGNLIRAVDYAGGRHVAYKGRVVPVNAPYEEIADADFIRIDRDIAGRPIGALDWRGAEWVAIDGQWRRRSSLAVSLAAIAFGDSTTFGGDLVSPETDRWSTLLAATLGITIHNAGVSGQRAEEIVARMGGEPVIGQVSGGSIPASGAVQITGLTVNPTNSGAGAQRFDLYSFDGTVVPGVIGYVSASVVNFTRSVPGSALAADWIELHSDFGEKARNSLSFIGMGINNEQLISDGAQTISQLKGWYRKATSSLKTNPQRLVVWGMLDRGPSEAAGTTNGNIIAEMERWLVETYGSDFCPVRQYLSSPRALTEAQLVAPTFVPTADDNAAVAAKTIPPSFRFNASSVHLNVLGNKMQALCLKRHVLQPAKRWMINL